MFPWSLQLAPLASQHHLSEYSRIKHGHRGAPVLYAPLSPDVVRRLRERQQKYADQVLWWPCPPRPLRAPQLRLELSAALAESIAGTVKTSETHPINVSPVIPPESLAAISAHLTPCKWPCPVLFEIHLPYSLDHIAAHIPQHKRVPSNDLRSSVAGALSAALSTKLSLPFKRSPKAHTPDGASSSDVVPVSSQSRLPPVLVPPATYALHPFSRPPTAPSPPHKMTKFRSMSSSFSRQGTKPFKLGNLLLSSCPGKKVRLSGPARGRSAVCRDLDVDLRRMKMLGARCVVCCLDDEELEFLVGTSWAEYCQVAHREGLDVLRIPLPEGLAPLSPKSLDVDLNRIIEKYTLHGTSVLVHCRGGVGRAGLLACCWMLKLGLCGWIETDIPPSAPAPSIAELNHDSCPSETFRWDSDTVVRRDTLQLVERLIEVVRRRRSVKAIETLEQVQFLVEYVDYLRTRARGDGS